MAARIGVRAVVLGGSITGLLMARALSDAYDEVQVVDRDELVGVTGYRRGVPQGRHVHGLLARGALALEELLPGLTAQLRDAGVVTGDLNNDNHWWFNGKQLRRGHSGVLCIPATRPVLEYHIRQRIQALPNVVFREGYDITGLVADRGRTRITGVRVVDRGAGGAEEVVEADLVVDATGRGSRTPVWLAGFGYPKPDEEQVKVDVGYATRHFLLAEDIFGSDLGIIAVAYPGMPRGAVFYPIPGEDRRQVELTLSGLLGDHPPTDPDGFLEFARSLPAPQIYDAIKNAQPLDDAVAIRYPANTRRRYERLSRVPERLLVVGDAVCSLNPLYAQGMSLSALEALALSETLRQGPPSARAFHRKVAGVVDQAWEMTTSVDLSFPDVQGRRTAKVRIGNAYMSRLQQAAVHDADLTTALLRTAGLVDPPQKLMRPSVMLRVARVLRSARQQDAPV